MKLYIAKPYLFFLLSIPIIILFGMLGRNEMVDINVHDTYLVFRKIDLTFLIATFFGIIGLGYWIMLKTNRKLSKLLNVIHIGLTFGGILIIWGLYQLYRESIMAYDFNNNLTLAIYFIALIIIVGQVIYFINITNGIIKKRNSISYKK